MPRLAPEIVAAVRARYEAGVPLAAIRAEFGINNEPLYACLRAATGPDGESLPPVSLRRPNIRRGVRGPRRPLDRKAVVAQLWLTAARHIRDIDARLTRLRGEAPPADTRALATLVRALRELARFEQDGAGAKQNADGAPRDVEEFRRELVRKMDALVAGRTD